ncbi:MAG: fumarylacetoacetate hydrolase family protein [Gammaproteobacteria bacterium]|nr:fumarylacetoacetate hydrolase family protein [Gammaproteobacteria bacterium]
MHLASYTVGGHDSYGIVTADGIIDARRRLGPEFATLRAVLAAEWIDALAAFAAASPDYAIEQVAFLPVIPDPSKILCVGINYQAHIRETKREPPQHPWLFVRFANTLVGHGQPLLRPKVSTKYDFEGELAVVIGRRARYVPAAQALTHVAGYSCFNDGTIRDWQIHSPLFTAGKNFHRSGALGPVLATADAIPDPARLHLQTRLNGQVMQQSGIDDLCFDVPALIAYCSTFAQLEPGDIIATGTPGGAGAFRDPRVWLCPGDVVEVEISGIGVLRNPVADE